MRGNLPVFKIALHPQKFIRKRNRKIDFLKLPLLNTLSDLNYEVGLPTNIYMPRPRNESVKNVSNTFIFFLFLKVVYDKVDMEASLCLEPENA